MRMRFPSIFLLSICLSAPGIAWSQPSEGLEDAPRIYRELGLTQDQQDRLRDLRTHRDRIQDLTAQNARNRAELNELLKADGTSEQEVLDVTSRLNEGLAELNLARVQNLWEIKQILSVEQLGKAIKLMAAHSAASQAKAADERVAGSSLSVQPMEEAAVHNDYEELPEDHVTAD